MSIGAESPELVGIDLEDSYVLNVESFPSNVWISFDFVLTEEHPSYLPPDADSQFCFRRGRIVFHGVTHCDWSGQGELVPARDANNEIDYGHLDEFSNEGKRYSVSGEFGAMKIEADRFEVQLE
ncbi:hypothetical protein [Subtercola endophyticus]|uniref:hypothetical protein n=1 Tax=Subtercola endophyticus TaxID=2895559 RepID=UPI001E50E27F|nr:hypothetical protein [Subtercola endophyticus]UFS59093.1 hypothetical protein LQ955_19295 [Subtercola endophyticus]